VNTITISGLTSSTLYRYAISLGAPYNTQLKNGAAYFEIATPASGQPVIPTTLAGKVLDGNAQPVQGVVAFVQVDNAWPVLGISDANGIFLVELSNIRLISDGSSVTVTDGTTVSIDVHHATGNKTGITYQLLGGSPYQSGIYTLE
jgi:hypothetical protein